MEAGILRFPILIHQDEGNASFGVTVPDLPGCFSAGGTLDDVFGPHGVEEAILLHVEGMLEDGEALPECKSISDRQNEDWSQGYGSCFWAIVGVDLSPVMPDVA